MESNVIGIRVTAPNIQKEGKVQPGTAPSSGPLPRNASDTDGRPQPAAPAENIVKTVDKAEAIRTARAALTGQYLPDPVQTVEKASSWEFLFQEKGALSGMQVVVDKTTGKARLGISR